MSTSERLRLLERARLHELPVAWDGAPVTWGDPHPVGAVFICPPPKVPQACTSCGQLAVDGADSYLGTVAGDPVQPYWIRDRRTARPRKVPGWETRHPKLMLTRCLGCGHDQVVDLDTGELWDLDETDYGDAGSVHPEQVPGPQGQLW